MNIFGYNYKNKFLHIDYNLDLDAIKYDEITTKEILEYITLLDSYLHNKFGNEQKNNFILNELFNELSNRINDYFQEFCSNLFVILELIDGYSCKKKLHSTAGDNFVFLMNSLFEITFINTFNSNNRLLIILIQNIKKYLVYDVEKIILDKINELKKAYKYEKLIIEKFIAITNDLELIKNELVKQVDNILLNEIEKNQVDNELGEINYMINTKIEIILNELVDIIITDFDEVKISNKLNIDIIIATLDDYFSDLVNWMEKKNLLSLIEKIYLKIINSELIEKKISDTSRDKFEEYIRVKLNEL